MAALTVIQAASHTSSDSYLGFAQAPVRQIIGFDNSFRSAGPIGDPNFYALVLAVLIPIALMRVRDETRLTLRVAAAATVLLLIGAVALTYSRGGLVTVLVALAGFALLARARLRHVLLAAAVALPLLPVVPAHYFQRIATLASGDNSISGRTASQDVALSLFANHPLGGVGANNYTATYLPYAIRGNEPNAAEQSHNLYLAIAAETGILGLGAFLIAMALVVRVGWRRRAGAAARGERQAEGLATAFLAALGTYLVGVAFLPIAYPRYLWMLVGLVLAGSVTRLAPRRATTTGAVIG
jgi:putative inorganic carbon (HCO3(-)) transporter